MIEGEDAEEEAGRHGLSIVEAGVRGPIRVVYVRVVEVREIRSYTCAQSRKAEEECSHG